MLRVPSVNVISGVYQISAGGGLTTSHTCVVLSVNGGVRCWGYNLYGQLGNGGTSNVLTVPSVNVISGAWQISAGYYHTGVVLSVTGGVRCWGYNYFGQLGNGGTSDVLAVPCVDVISGVWQIACGFFHACVVLIVNGGVRCWGRNLYGQLGNGGLNASGAVLSAPSVPERPCHVYTRAVSATRHARGASAA